MSARFVGRSLWLTTVVALVGCSLVYDTNPLTSGAGDDSSGSGTGSAAMGSTGNTRGGTSSGASSNGGSTSAGSSNGGTSSAGSSKGGSSSAGSTNGGGSSAGTSAGDGGEGGAIADCGEIYYLDGDDDGYGDDSAPIVTCETAGYVATAGDCDDGNPFVHPELPEYCDGLDNDCDTGTGDVCPVDCEWDEESVPIYMHCWTPTSWPDASAICADHAMRLVRIDDVAEQDYLFAWHTPDHAWTGGSDAADEGVWEWEDGEVLWDMGVSQLYTAWSDYEPNNLSGNEHCLMLNGEMNHWNDNTCEYSFGFACERY